MWFASHQSSPFLNSVCDFMSARRYSKRTIKWYLYWIEYFIVFQKMRHPETMAPIEVEQFLTYLAVTQNVSASTHKIALNAFAYLYNRVLEQPLMISGNLIEQKHPASSLWF
jgi:hypothetical protein